MVLMAADTPNRMEFRPGTNMSISLSGDDHKELSGYWDSLSKDAKITMPLTKAAWGDTFGMLTDKFGVSWLVNIAAPKAQLQLAPSTWSPASRACVTSPRHASMARIG